MPWFVRSAQDYGRRVAAMRILPLQKDLTVPDKFKPRVQVSFLLVSILLIALLLRVAVAIHFPSIEYADEIYNTLEPAHRLAYGYGIVDWEWRRGARSWVFPAFLAGVMRATD